MRPTRALPLRRLLALAVLLAPAVLLAAPPALAAEGTAAARTRLQSADAGERLQAATILGNSGDAAAAPDLVEALADGSAAVREAAAAALGKLGAVEAVPALARLLADENSACRDTAARVLEGLATRPGACAALIGALAGPPAVRAGLLPAVASCGDDRALAALGAAVADADAQVAAAAERIVRMAPRDRATRAVLGCLDSTVDRVRAACVALTGDMRLAGALPRLETMLGERVETAEALAAARRAVQALRDELDPTALMETARTGATAELRRDALGTLAALKDERAYQALVRALGDSEERVRAAAADMLGELGDSRAVGPLSRAVDEPRNARIRRALQRALDLLTGAAKARTN